jgi:hypothetical protein
MMNISRLCPVRSNSTQLNSTQQRQGLLFANSKTQGAFVKGYVELVNSFVGRDSPWEGMALKIVPSIRRTTTPANDVLRFRTKEQKIQFSRNRELGSAIDEVLAHAIKLFYYFGRVNSSSTLVSRIDHADLSKKTPDRLQAFVSAPLSASLTTQITPASLNEKGSSTSLFNTTELAGLGNAPKIWAQETPDSLIVPGKLAIQQELIASLGKLRLPSDSNPAGSRDVQLILSPVKKDETHGRVVEQFEAAKRALTQFWRDLAQPTQATFEQIGIEGA